MFHVVQKVGSQQGDRLGWLDRIEEQLGHSCNGDVSREDGIVICRMDNGIVKIFETPDGTKMLMVRKGGDQAKIEAYPEGRDPYDEPVITRSLSGSLEILTRRGRNPSIIVKQEEKNFVEISVFADVEANKMSLYGVF